MGFSLEKQLRNIVLLFNLEAGKTTLSGPFVVLKCDLDLFFNLKKHV